MKKFKSFKNPVSYNKSKIRVNDVYSTMAELARGEKVEKYKIMKLKKYNNLIKNSDKRNSYVQLNSADTDEVRTVIRKMVNGR